MKKIRIASGAGYAGDRIEPALDAIMNGDIDYISFECLAERTIAIAQQEKEKDSTKGYNNLLEHRFSKILSICSEKNIKIITNMGAANPLAAVKKIKEIAEKLNVKNIKIAAVLGDDISSNINSYLEKNVLELNKPLKEIKDYVISANVYLGSEGIVEALKNGANIIVTGRCSDPAIFLAPLIYEFNWDTKDYDKIAKGIMLGHLLECGAQVTGGYYSTPGYTDIDNLWNVGFPIAEVSENGDMILSKTNTSSGIVNIDTCKEQLIYEIHDPKNYITPDGIADFTTISLKETEKNKVLLTGATGKTKPDTLKVSIGYKDCYIGESEISYGGSKALDKAKLAAEIVKRRLEILNIKYEEIRIDYIGCNSLYGNKITETFSSEFNKIGEVRLRIAVRTKDKESAQAVVNEVETLYTNGPSGGGGVTKKVNDVISICSIFIPREDINMKVVYEEVL